MSAAGAVRGRRVRRTDGVEVLVRALLVVVLAVGLAGGVVAAGLDGAGGASWRPVDSSDTVPSGGSGD